MKTTNGLPEDFEEQVAAIMAAVPPENAAAAEAIHARWRASLAAQPPAPKPREPRTLRELWAAVRLGFRQILMQWRHPEALLAMATVSRREHKVMCWWLRAIETLIEELITAQALAIAPILTVEPQTETTPRKATPSREARPAIPDPNDAATWRCPSRRTASGYTRKSRSETRTQDTAASQRKRPATSPDDPVSTRAAALRLEAIRRVIVNRRAIAHRRARRYARQRARDARLPDPARFPRRLVNPHPMLGSITGPAATAHDRTYDTWVRWRGPD